MLRRRVATSSWSEDWRSGVGSTMVLAPQRLGQKSDPMAELYN
jgi:hypothetical protein